MSSGKYTVSAVFQCAKCEREWEGYKTAQALARAHARSTGHHVNGEIVTAYSYNMSEEKL